MVLQLACMFELKRFYFKLLCLQELSDMNKFRVVFGRDTILIYVFQFLHVNNTDDVIVLFVFL